jgi:hypothetical protein
MTAWVCVLCMLVAHDTKPIRLCEAKRNQLSETASLILIFGFFEKFTNEFFPNQ